MSSVYLVMPKTPEAENWLYENTDGQWLGSSLAVEWRYLDNLLEGMTGDGLALGTDYEVLE